MCTHKQRLSLAGNHLLKYFIPFFLEIGCIISLVLNKLLQIAQELDFN